MRTTRSQQHLSPSFGQSDDRGLRRLFARAAPIQIEQDVHVSFATLDFRHIGLIDFEPDSKLCLRQSDRPPQVTQVLSEHLISAMVNGRGHPLMLCDLQIKAISTFYCVSLAPEKMPFRPFMTTPWLANSNDASTTRFTVSDAPATPLAGLGDTWPGAAPRACGAQSVRGTHRRTGQSAAHGSGAIGGATRLCI